MVRKITIGAIVWLLCGAMSVAVAQRDSAREKSAEKKQTIAFSVTALKATQEKRSERYFDEGAERAKKAVSDLGYDTYKKLLSKELNVEMGQEASCALTGRYVLYITPVSQEKDGRVRANLRVTMSAKGEENKTVNAVSSTIVLSPGQDFKLRGLRLDEGELVVVLALRAQ